MLFFLTSRLVSSIGAFIYPGYASYKTLSQRPASPEELERWLMYWSVLGCVIGVEYIAEWLVSWIPFYYTLKTLFLLYLVLPQTRGSSYIFVNHLSPFFRSHESQIDATLTSLRVRMYAFLQERFRALWDYVSSTTGLPREATLSREIDSSTPPTLHDPASGPAQLVSSLWNSYGPGIIASGAALLRQAAVGATNTRQEQRTDYNPPFNSNTGSVREENRFDRRELSPEPLLVPGASPALGLSRGASEYDIRHRERRNSNGSGSRFEEIEVPSDIEGYDVAQDAGSEAGPSPGSRTSWFGWGVPSKNDRERTKKD